MRKRSEIGKKPTRWCGEPLSHEDLCGIPLEYRAEGLFCTVHGYNNPVLDKNPEESVESLSQQIKEQLATSSTEELAKRQAAVRQHGDRPEAFGSANRAKEKPIRDDFGRITESIFLNDVEETWKKLEADLRVGEDRSDRGIVLRALDNAEANARTAHRLWITAKLEQQRYEITNKIVFGALREEANRVLQREKDQKLRSKQITEEDIENMSAQLYPDEFEEQTIRRKKAELMVKSLENLAEMWKQRCSALEVMLGKSR